MGWYINWNSLMCSLVSISASQMVIRYWYDLCNNVSSCWQFIRGRFHTNLCYQLSKYLRSWNSLSNFYLWWNEKMCKKLSLRNFWRLHDRKMLCNTSIMYLWLGWWLQQQLCTSMHRTNSLGFIWRQYIKTLYSILFWGPLCRQLHRNKIMCCYLSRNVWHLW